MPELPEVETVCRGMREAITGRTIKAVRLNRAGLRTPFPAGLAKMLTGRNIRACRRRAKYILVELAGDQILVLHLGMSGQIFLIHKGSTYEARKHDHFELDFDDGSRLAFNDARRFGQVLLVAEEDLDAHPAFKGLGPEPLEPAFTGKALAALLFGKKADIKTALMDQKTVAGLGNIYCSEALFHAGIDPRRPAGQLGERECSVLAAAIKKVLRAAIRAGGSTLKDFRHADGELGYFQHKFAVYGRGGKGLPRLRL